MALLGNAIFKPFMRLFYLEYGLPSDLLFFANNALHSTVQSSSGIRQGSALSSMYFCALLQGPLMEVANLYPEVNIRAYQDDVTLSSKNLHSLEAAFLHLRELTADLSLDINFRKCEWFQKAPPCATQPLPLESLGVNFRTDAIKILGAYIGADQVVESLLLQKLEKHKCLFRRLLKMGPSNLSLAILRRCTIPRHDYHLRVHRPNATLHLAQVFDTEVGKVLEKWCGADSNALQLANPKKKSKSFRIAPDGRWQARPFTDRFGSSEADVLYQFPLVQGGTNVLLPTRCVDELYVNTAYPRGVSRVRELVP